MTEPDVSTRLIRLMEAYLGCDYLVEPQGRCVALRIAMPADRLRRIWPEPQSFGLLSAWNPGSLWRDATTNHAADLRLQGALQASGALILPAIAAAADPRWQEPSWLVADMPQASFDALARDFGQLAWLYWRAEKPVRLRVDAARPALCAHHDAIDWLQ